MKLKKPSNKIKIQSIEKNGTKNFNLYISNGRKNNITNKKETIMFYFLTQYHSYDKQYTCRKRIY